MIGVTYDYGYAQAVKIDDWIYCRGS